MRYLKTPATSVASPATSVAAEVAAMAEQLRRQGWNAVEALSRSLDHFEGPFRVPAEALSRAAEALPSALRSALLTAAENVRAFCRHQRALLHDGEWELSPGLRTGLRFLPVRRAAVYIPGGRYPLPSTAVMGVVPAQEAGVERIVALSPPRKGVGVDPVVLGTLGLLGVEEVWALGGVQGVGALALGLGPVERADLLVGPGNAWVTEAKRQFFGELGIDGLAGPSEVCIVADKSADPATLAADLLAQAEHDPLAKGVLLSLDEALGEKTLEEVQKLLAQLPTEAVARSSWERFGVVAVVSLEEAVNFANDLAPEHLELALTSPRSVLPLFRSYGAAFLGHASAEAFGDYVAGTNHILPTGGRARFSGGVWVGTFLRPLTHLEMSTEAAEQLAPAGEILAAAEGLAAHGAALAARRRP